MGNNYVLENNFKSIHCHSINLASRFKISRLAYSFTFTYLHDVVLLWLIYQVSICVFWLTLIKLSVFSVKLIYIWLPHVYCFSIRGFFHFVIANHRAAGEKGVQFEFPICHFRLLLEHLEINRAISTGTSLPLISSDRIRTGKLQFSRASR